MQDLFHLMGPDWHIWRVPTDHGTGISMTYNQYFIELHLGSSTMRLLNFLTAVNVEEPQHVHLFAFTKCHHRWRVSGWFDACLDYPHALAQNKSHDIGTIVDSAVT
jgi:hypothetical protein